MESERAAQTGQVVIDFERLDMKSGRTLSAETRVTLLCITRHASVGESEHQQAPEQQRALQ